MLILKKKEPAPLELPGGVVLMVRPVGQADWDVARARAVTNIAAAASAEEAAARYGFNQQKVADFVASDFRIGEAAIAIELGVEAIESWVGVGVSEDKPAPVSVEYIALFMNEWADEENSYASLFLSELRKRRAEERKEGNGSSVAPGGSGAAARNIATIAETSASPAPEAGAATAAKNAPKRKTRR